MLLELRVGAPRDLALAVEHEAGGTRGPLVDREDHPREAIAAGYLSLIVLKTPA